MTKDPKLICIELNKLIDVFDGAITIEEFDMKSVIIDEIPAEIREQGRVLIVDD